MTRADFLLLDAREGSEYQRCHLVGAQNIDIEASSDPVKELRAIFDRSYVERKVWPHVQTLSNVNIRSSVKQDTVLVYGKRTNQDEEVTSSKALRRVVDALQTVKGDSIKKLYVLKDTLEDFESRYPFLVKRQPAQQKKR